MQKLLHESVVTRTEEPTCVTRDVWVLLALTFLFGRRLDTILFHLLNLFSFCFCSSLLFFTTRALRTSRWSRTAWSRVIRGWIRLAARSSWSLHILTNAAFCFIRISAISSMFSASLNHGSIFVAKEQKIARPVATLIQPIKSRYISNTWIWLAIGINCIIGLHFCVYALKL